MCGSGYTLKKNRVGYYFFKLFFLEYSDLLGNENDIKGSIFEDIRGMIQKF